MSEPQNRSAWAAAVPFSKAADPEDRPLKQVVFDKGYHGNKEKHKHLKKRKTEFSWVESNGGGRKRASRPVGHSSPLASFSFTSSSSSHLQVYFEERQPIREEPCFVTSGSHSPLHPLSKRITGANCKLEINDN
ncbi:hypothetical protein EYF80_044224 [Liparis tanakae]|uniref:Uncharacterized protein n=1 Tax=Liparis tanakae TaxID=230148 RepID=A0A4Z2FZ07_9TELE|nr:hypothetical protein EYF80_044224 [Liparis tanakae]